MDAHIYIYNEIGSFGVTADQVRDQIQQNSGADRLIIHISSPGGEVFEGWTIGNILKNSGKKVQCIIEGLCASIATYIALQADEVLIAETARFMIHNPLMGLEGDEHDMMSASKQLRTIKKDLVKTYQKKTGLDYQSLSDMMNDETWFTAQEAVSRKFVDGIVKPSKAVAKLDLNKINMKEEIKEEKETSRLNKKLDEFIDKFEKWIKPKNEGVVNVLLELQEGGALFIMSEDGDLVGKPAYVADADGNKTEEPAPEGMHMLADGRSITINSEGTVEGISEAAPAEAMQDDKEKDELKARVAELEAEIQAKDATNEKLSNEIEEVKSVLADMGSEIRSIKSLTAGGDQPISKAYVKPKDKSITNTIEEGAPLQAWFQSIKN